MLDKYINVCYLSITRHNTQQRKEQTATAKTTTSTEVKTRWINANYKRYGVSLRYDTDGDIIDFLEQHKDAEGKGTTEIIRAALKQYMGG